MLGSQGISISALCLTYWRLCIRGRIHPDIAVLMMTTMGGVMEVEECGRGEIPACVVVDTATDPAGCRYECRCCVTLQSSTMNSIPV